MDGGGLRAHRPGCEELALGRVLDVQFWLMGRDVEHPGGNLLPRLGFTRQKVPDRPWPSRYRRAEPGGYVIIWQCGLLLQGPGRGCLLLRGREPAAVTRGQLDGLYDLDGVSAAQRQGSGCPPRTLARACRWFARYEAAVAATAGVAHRVPRPGSAPLLAPAEPCSLEREWRELAVRHRGTRRLLETIAVLGEVSSVPHVPARPSPQEMTAALHGAPRTLLVSLMARHLASSRPDPVISDPAASALIR